MSVPRGLRDLATIAVLVALLGAVYLLPPDTSLSEVRRAGKLDVCVPSAYPPLVTGDPARPGLDVELLAAAAARMGLTLSLTVVPAMGRDFNPRIWRITRARCQVVAGGVVDTPVTRSFLDVTAPHAETGWAAVTRDGSGPPDLTSARVGVLAATSGIDRLALSRVLRASGAVPTIVRSAEDLAAGLSAGRYDIAIAEALVADRIAADHRWSVSAVPGLPARYPVVFGLWKGDLTLHRALDAALAALSRDGTAAAIRARYLGDAPAAGA